MIGKYDNRLVFVDILRGFAAVMMILGHSIIRYPVNISEVGWCDVLESIIYSFHMELFFFIGGIVYHCENYRKYIKNKSTHLIIPYCFFGIINMLLHTTGNNAINPSKIVTVNEGIFRFLFMGGTYWFLYTMFLIFAIYPYIDKIFKNWGWKLFLSVLLILLQYFFSFPSLLTISNIVYYIPYFIAGDFVKNFYSSNMNEERLKQDRNLLLFILLVGLLATIGFLFIGLADKVESNIVIKYVVSFSIILVLLPSSLFIDNRKIIKMFTECSRYSLQLYLFNGYIMTIIRIILCNVIGVKKPYIIILCIWIPDIIITITICKIIERIPALSKLCGMRVKE